MSLIGVNILGSTFVQDPHPDWIKIDNVSIGESQEYGYKTANSKDIGGLLNNLSQDYNAVCVVYNWTNFTAYIKKGFKISLNTDSKIATGYTTFVSKKQAARFYESYPTPAPVTKTQVLVAPYCMPGSNVMRATLNLNWVPHFTLAFWNGYNWDCGDPGDSLIQDVRAKGGDCSVSFGGYGGCNNKSESALMGGNSWDVMARYKTPIERYNFVYADFDIEGGWEKNQYTYELRNTSITMLQKWKPSLKISFTVPADQNGIYCLPMLQDAMSKGVIIDTLRVMLMNFNGYTDMVSACINGLKNIHQQLISIGLGGIPIGFIPLLMKDDNGVNNYTLSDHNAILYQIKSQGMTYVTTFSFWELAIDQKQNFEFLKAYLNF